MPGYLFRPPAADPPLRTLIMKNGSDGPMTSIWPSVSAGGVARGYNVLIFDGPGQQSMLFERGVPFRHDWEHVITPVLDLLLARSDVESATPAERQNWEWRAKPYGLDSPFDVVDQITTPLLITDPEGERATRRSASRASAGIVRRPRRSASGIRH